MMANLGKAAFLLFALAILIWAFLDSQNSPAPYAASTPSIAKPTIVPPEIGRSVYAVTDAIQNTSLEFTWEKSQFNIMTADFKVTNRNDFDIKDLEIRCEHSAPSGTKVDSTTKTIYESVQARSTRTIKRFNMGFIHSQSARTGCSIKDLTIGQNRPAPEKPSPKTTANPGKKS